MNPMQLKRLMTMAAVTVLASATVVQADLWKDVTRGFELFGYQISGERNLLGNGWTINANTVYSDRRFNLGFADLRLGTGGLPAPVNFSAGYTLRGIPSAQFTWNTGSPAQPLGYVLDLNSGLQDTTFTGSILIDMATNINALGFYDLSLQVSNRGTYRTDGLGGTTTGTLDFDVGPIDVSGSVFADALAAVTQPFFAATGTENPFVKFSERASKVAEATTTASQLRARIAAGEILSDQEMTQLVNNTVVAAMLNGEPTDKLLGDLMAPYSLQASDSVAFYPMATAEGQSAPEPASAALMLLALPAFARPRRRRQAR